VTAPDRLTPDQEVDQLVGGWTHAERHLIRTSDRKQRAERHLSAHRSLLDQLRRLACDLPGQVEDATRRVPDSTPPGSWGALTAVLRIEAAAAAWVDQLRMPLRADPEGNLRFLLAQTLIPAHGQQIADDIHRWWTIARVEAGWDDPPRTLQDPCPYEDCGNRSIRVRAGVSAAWCSDCGATWDATSIGVLGGMLAEARALREAEAAYRRAQDRADRREQAAAQVSGGGSA
jgi:hypothetical protein